ncbi:MAG: DUF481 domain-containing protein [Phycisphaerales bacterium]|nr:DUF481 domain-containing protein [Phycisphaerales bacterium]
MSPYLSIAALLLVPSMALADEVTLTTGERLEAPVQLIDCGQLRLTHPILGQLNIPTSNVASLVLVLPDGRSIAGTITGCDHNRWTIQPESGDAIEIVTNPAGLPRQADQDVDPTTPSGDAPVDTPVDATASPATGESDEALPEVPAESPWSGNLSAGGTLSQGTSDAANLLLDVSLVRTTESAKTNIGAFYVLNTSAGDITQNWFQADVDQEWLLPGFDQRLFFAGGTTFDYQEQADWEQRVNANVGLRYTVVDFSRPASDGWLQRLRLTGMVEPGIRKEFAGDFTDPALELLLGGAVDMDLFDRITLRADGRVFPDLTDTSQVRATASAKASVHLDELKSWAVGLELKYQYQSRVNPGTPNDLFVLAGTLDYSF